MSGISKPEEGAASSGEVRRNFDDVIAEAKRRIEALAALESAFAVAAPIDDESLVDNPRQEAARTHNSSAIPTTLRRPDAGAP